MMSDQQALYTGLLMGFLAREGVDVVPVLDDHKNYTNQLVIAVDNVAITVEVKDWIEVR